MTRPGNTTEPLLDLHQLATGIRRQRRVWLSFAVLGLLAGALLAVLVPAPPTAVARLLIIHEEDQPSDGGSLMRTDLALFQTNRIAAAALDKLALAERPEDFLETYQGVGLTSNVLELRVTGASDQDAVARATALAEVFVADHVQRIQSAADAEAKALIDQRNLAQAELTKVDASIVATQSESDNENATDLESLYARRAELASQISDLGRRAQEAGMGAPRVTAGTRIVDAPHALADSLLTTGATNAGIGLVLGLIIGLGLAAVTSVVRDRPVLRREFTDHLGASVIAQLRRPRRGPAGWWRGSRIAAERRRVAATLVRTIRDDPGSVSLLQLGCPRTAAALAGDLAVELADDGPVVIVDDLPRRNLLKRDLDRRKVSSDRVQVVAVGEGLPAIPAEQRAHQLGLGSVEPGTAWTDLSWLGEETVLLVRAGHANTTWLHTVARQLADSGIPVIGVVLVDPDPKDRTDGTLWDGLHTALRGRAARAARTDEPDQPPATAEHDQPTRRLAPVQPGTAVNGSAAGGQDGPTKQLTPVWPAGSENVEVP